MSSAHYAYTETSKLEFVLPQFHYWDNENTVVIFKIRAELVKRPNRSSDMLSIKGGAYHARMGSYTKNIEFY